MLVQCLPENNPAVLPDLSFTVQEIVNKFTLQRVILESQNASPNYLLSSGSNEFDSAPTNIPQGYDLVNARADALRATTARLDYIRALRSAKGSDVSSEERSVSSETSPESKEQCV